MARDGYLIIDSDLHMMEPDDLWARYLDEPYRANPPRFFGGQQQKLARKRRGQGQRRHHHGHGGAGAGDPGARQGAGRDRVQPRAAAPQPRAAPAFPGRAGARLRSGLDPDRDGHRGRRRRRDVRHARAADPVPRRSRAGLRRGARARLQQLGAPTTARADPTRLKFAAQIAMHDVRLAVEEARRCVKELGAVAVIGTPNPVNGQHLHDEACEPLWDALEELERSGRLPPDRQHLAQGRCRAALRRPRQFPPDRPRHPQSRRADGRDRQHDHRRRARTPSEAARRLSRRHRRLAATGGCGGWTTSGRSSGPAANASSRCFRASTSSASAISRSTWTRNPRCTSVNNMGADYFVVSSDYPHSDGAFPDAMKEFFGMALTDEQRRKILWDNCARLYAIPRPAAPLTRELPQAAAE